MPRIFRVGRAHSERAGEPMSTLQAQADGALKTMDAGAEVRTEELEAVGMRTRVLAAGPGEGEEAVVFLHGGPGSAHDWGHLLPQVRAVARAGGPGLPGGGRVGEAPHRGHPSAARAQVPARPVRSDG